MNRYQPRSPADRELQTHLRQAMRSLDQSLDVCGRVARQRSPERVVQKEARQRVSEEAFSQNPEGPKPKKPRDIPGPRRVQEVRVEIRRAKEVLRKLQEARGMLASIGPLSPGYDRADPDLMPENLRTPESRREVRRKRQAAKKKAQAEAVAAAFPQVPEEVSEKSFETGNS